MTETGCAMKTELSQSSTRNKGRSALDASSRLRRVKPRVNPQPLAPETGYFDGTNVVYDKVTDH